MSSQGSSLLDLDVRARRWERRLALGAVSIAILIPWLLQLGAWIVAILSAVSGVTVLCGLYRAGWIGTAERLARVTWLADGRWLLSDVHGRRLETRLHAGTRVGARYVWLQWHGERRRSMLLAGADLRREEMRRLSARLRMEGHREVGKRVSNQDFVT